MFGSLAVLFAMGCGGRTSTLDPDVYSEEQPSSIGTGGGSGAGKSGAGNIPGGAGKATGSSGSSTGSGGKSGGLDPSASADACKDYCGGFTPNCPARLNGQNCFDSCSAEVNGSGKKCQTLGITVLRCLTPYFSKLSGTGCENIINNALTTCGDEIQTFENCKAGNGSNNPGMPTPNPNPMPNPTPTPTPTPVPTNCPGVGEGGPGYCKLSYSCPDGPYTISCYSAADGASYCSCYWPNGSQSTVTAPPADIACDYAGKVCGF